MTPAGDAHRSLSGADAAAAVVRLAEQEFQAQRLEAAASVCQEARRRLGDLPELVRIHSSTSAWVPLRPEREHASEEIHVAMGDLNALLGSRGEAETSYRHALGLNANVVRAHLGLARLRMPGPDYIQHLTNLHALVLPSHYLEIGVAGGTTLALAQPPTIAIGVDPAPKLESGMNTETHLFAVTSDEFFKSGHLRELLGGARIAMTFIDGLHHFDQALRDFANVERWSAATSIVLVHDTFPLDEVTQRRQRSTDYWTGDTWKVVVCLRELRPDLDIFTIATPPAGMTVISGLVSASEVLREAYDKVVARYLDMPFLAVEDELPKLLDLVPSDWNAVLGRLPAYVRRAGNG